MSQIFVIKLDDTSGEKISAILEQLVAEQVEGNHQPRRQEPYNVDEAAKVLGVSKSTIYSRTQAGIIKRIPNIGKVMIPANEIERLVS